MVIKRQLYLEDLSTIALSLWGNVSNLRIFNLGTN